MRGLEAMRDNADMLSYAECDPPNADQPSVNPDELEGAKKHV